MISREILENGEKALEKELNKLFSKTELSATDWDAVKKAMCILNMFESYKEGEPFDESGMSYGRPRMYHDDPYRMMSDVDWHHGNSYERGRSPVTGRYVSRGYNVDGGNYSGHSVEDRMIMALEQQMDGVKSDYERQQVEKEIQRIRRGDMGR